MAWRIINLFRKPVPKGEILADKYIPFGPKDAFPLEWSELIDNSPSAVSCLSTLQDFIEGYGFSDESLESRIVNSKGETLWQVHQQSAASLARFDGFYWLLRFNAEGKVSDWTVLDFESCRLGKPDSEGYISHILYNPFFGMREYQQGQNVCFNVWNPATVRDEILKDGPKYKGQVFFFGTTTPLSRYYPRPEAYSAFRWMEIEAGVAKYHTGNINRGFMPKFMMTIYGDPSAPSTNPDYQEWSGGEPATQAQEFQDQISRDFMGIEALNNLFINWVQNKEEKPDLDAFPTQANGDMFMTLDNQAIKKITIAWKTPAILANINEGVSLGGDGNAVRVAVKLMQQRVVNPQRFLTDAYQKILRNSMSPYAQAVDIVPYNPYPEMEIIDQKIWDAMTAEERRRWIQENTEISLDTPQQTQVTNAIMLKYPKKVVGSIKRVQEYIEQSGAKCSGAWGKEIAARILNNENLGLKEMKRLYGYLKTNEQYSNAVMTDGCEALKYHQLGGKEMFDFLDVELKRVEQWLN